MKRQLSYSWDAKAASIRTAVLLFVLFILHALHMLPLWLETLLFAKKFLAVAGPTNGVNYLDAPTTPNSSPNTFNASNCAPRMIVFDDAMSLTRANITGWNQSDIESQMFKEVGLDRVISQTKEARMAGAVQRTLMDLLISRHAPMRIGGAAAPQSVIQPFDLIPRRNRVNPGYFRISAGAATVLADLQQAGVTSPGNYVPAACWTVTVNNGSIDADSSWLALSPNNVLKNIERYFLPRMALTIEWVANSGSKQTAVMHVIGAYNVDANQAKVVICPNKTFQGNVIAGGNNNSATPGWWENTATQSAQQGYQPSIGIVRLQANSVSDYEQYGAAIPGYNEYGLISYWHQTTRWVHKYNDEYLRALQASTTSEGLKKFRLLPLAKLRAQQEMIQDMAFYEACFYGDSEDENQSVSGWQSLPTVFDPAWQQSGESGTLALEYRSRTIGIRTQIAQCGNVFDMQNGPLDLDALFEAGYYVKREREGESGRPVTEIDIITDLRFTKGIIRQLMMKYYKGIYGFDAMQMHSAMDQKITFNGQVMFQFDSYDLPNHGYTLNVFYDEYFDDRISQFGNSQKSGGRTILMIDWSDITVGLIKMMSVPRTNNLADNIYKYVIAQNVQHVLLNSKKFEVRVGNTNRHRIFENYSAACPKVTVPGCDLAAN